MFLYGPTNPFPRAVSNALQFNRACADAKAIANTAPFATVHVAVSSAATVTKYYGMNGNGLGNAPTAQWNAPGYTRLTWEPTYEDVFGQRHAINLTCGLGTGDEPAPVCIVVVPVVYVFTNMIDVRTYYSNNGAAADFDYIIDVW